jgi:hypothetical protein
MTENDDLQYSAASNKSEMADCSAVRHGRFQSTLLGSKAGIEAVMIAVNFPTALFCFDPCFRDKTFPGVSHFNLLGSISLYPGHTTPAAEHLRHAGSVKSQTRQFRRHCQQCRFRSGSFIASAD